MTCPKIGILRSNFRGVFEFISPKFVTRNKLLDFEVEYFCFYCALHFSRRGTPETL